MERIDTVFGRRVDRYCRLLCGFWVKVGNRLFWIINVNKRKLKKSYLVFVFRNCFRFYEGLGFFIVYIC